MFTGMTIEDLIVSVQRAEQRVHEQHQEESPQNDDLTVQLELMEVAEVG